MPRGIQFRLWVYWMKRGGFKVFFVDESVFVYDSVPGSKYWYMGERINRVYGQPRKDQPGIRATTKGSSRSGPWTTRAGSRCSAGTGFHDTTALSFLRELRRQYGRVAVAWAGAAAHGQPNQGLESDRGIRMTLSNRRTAANPIEECWRIAKHHLLNSEYYRTFDDMKRAIVGFFRTYKFGFSAVPFYTKKTSLILENK